MSINPVFEPGTTQNPARMGGARPEPAVSSEWNQPVCADCWVTARGTQAAPHRLIGVNWGELLVKCCQCNCWTADGILVRLDPGAAPYPTMD